MNDNKALKVINGKIKGTSPKPPLKPPVLPKEKDPNLVNIKTPVK